MSPDKRQGAAAQNDAAKDLPAGQRPPSTVHSYQSNAWVPPALDALQQMLPQYQFISMLGAGGMGAVYKAMQTSLDRLVAIKILPPGLEDGSGANFTERFKQEAKTMAKLSHPCIVHVHDFGQMADGQFYFVMEFIEGTDVQKMIQANKKLSPDDALAITAHVCDALAYAHEHGIVHRDIKPANVLISAEGVVKIADFGLAKAVDHKSVELTRANYAMGTPQFMAPETMYGDVKVDGRADLYAVGVMLHNMLTGEIPTGMFKLPSKKVGCDPRFDKIVAKAMQEDREQRYQTAHQIRKDLDTILATPSRRKVLRPARHSRNRNRRTIRPRKNRRLRRSSSPRRHRRCRRRPPRRASGRSWGSWLRSRS
jgi:serine/threonine protein kinase